jgi:hypothetical protein
MNAFEILFTLVVLRIILPVGALLWIGERLQNHGRLPAAGGQG